MANNAKDFITAKGDKPFFLYFATTDPHRGGGKDKTSTRELKPDLFGNLPRKGGHKGVEEVFFEPAKVPIPPFLPDTPETREELAQYYQSCSRIDQGLGRLVAILKEAGIYDKTLIVFTADHGMAFSGGKTTVYEGGLRVPFVVRNPYEAKRGIESQAMISHIDELLLHGQVQGLAITPRGMEPPGAIGIRRQSRRGRLRPIFRSALRERCWLLGIYF